MAHEATIRRAWKALDSVVKIARKTDPEKLTWKPLDEGRSILEIMQEIAQAPGYVIGMLKERKMGEFTEEAAEQMMKERMALDSIDLCEQTARQTTEAYVAAVRDFPESDLQQTIWLPFDGGRDFTYEEVIDYPIWNCTYHEGQINYIHTLYGDKSY